MRPLYAVAVEQLIRGNWVANIVHMHADSPRHAEIQYKTAHPNRRTHRVVAVGPVIGYFVEDKKGEILSA